MKWITREKIKVDRVACPWLIKQFVDPEAEFVFLPHATDWSKIDNRIVFDVPNCELGHHGEDVSFDSILKRYNLTDPALVLLGEVVRTADSHPKQPTPSGRRFARRPGWRVTDANNYYVVRANALEGNVVLYKTVEGKRSSLQVKGRMFGYGVDAKVPSRKWSTLRVEFSGKLFTVFCNGERLFEVEDETFKDAGGVGVWTKADSVTLFDDFLFGGK
jgi:hypothetical protein